MAGYVQLVTETLTVAALEQLLTAARKLGVSPHEEVVFEWHKRGREEVVEARIAVNVKRTLVPQKRTPELKQAMKPAKKK